MRLMKSLTRFVAATAAAGLLMAPLAYADRSHGKRGYDRGHDRGYERNYSRGDQRGRGHNYRSDRHKSYNHHPKRSHYYNHHPKRSHYYSAPRKVVVHRPAPRVYYAPPRTTVNVSYGYSYGPHYHRGYAPRYNVGHYYSYAPRRTVYINDYHTYGLYAPPSGYHWVRDHDRGDAILASVATGAIIGLVVGALAH